MVFVADSFEWWVRWIPVVEWKVREGQKMPGVANTPPSFEAGLWPWGRHPDAIYERIGVL